MCDSSSTTNASSSSSIVVSMDEDEDYLSDSDCSCDSRREKEMDAANMLSSLRNVSGADPELVYPVSFMAVEGPWPDFRCTHACTLEYMHTPDKASYLHPSLPPAWLAAGLSPHSLILSTPLPDNIDLIVTRSFPRTD